MKHATNACPTARERNANEEKVNVKATKYTQCEAGLYKCQLLV
jgi:hypothetical protein